MSLDTFDAKDDQQRPNAGREDVGGAVVADLYGQDGRLAKPQTDFNNLIGLAARVRFLIGKPEEIPIGQQLAMDIEARIQAGEKKYGRRLETFNGRNPLVDLYQELLDAINYFKQGQLEGRL